MYQFCENNTDHRPPRSLLFFLLPSLLTVIFIMGSLLWAFESKVVAQSADTPTPTITPTPTPTPIQTREIDWRVDIFSRYAKRLHKSIFASGTTFAQTVPELCEDVVALGDDVELWAFSPKIVALNDPNVQNYDPLYETIWIQLCMGTLDPNTEFALVAPNGDVTGMDMPEYANREEPEHWRSYTFNRRGRSRQEGIYTLYIRSENGTFVKEFEVTNNLVNTPRFFVRDAETTRSISQLRAGQRIRIDYTNYFVPPGTEVEVGLYQDQQLVDTWMFTPDENGKYSEFLEIPTDAPGGTYTFVTELLSGYLRPTQARYFLQDTSVAYFSELKIPQESTATPIPTPAASGPTPVPTRVALAITVTATAAPTAEAAPVAASVPVGDSVTEQRVQGITASQPSQQSLLSITNVWDVAGYRDLLVPGDQNYEISLSANQDWRWGFAWCVLASEPFEEAISLITVNLRVDGRTVQLNEMLEYDQASNNGGRCYHWVTKLSGWEPGTEVRLEAAYRISAPLYDGDITYPPGNYRQVVDVQVR